MPSDTRQPSTPEPIRAQRTSRAKPVLRDVAYERFMEMLSERRLKPGHLVSQRELCEQTGTSIGAMREALKRLEAEAIVSLIPQRGVLVREIDARELADVYKLRELIEIPAARECARLGRGPALAESRRQTEAVIKREPTTPDESAFFARERMAIDEEFHFAIVAVFNNPLISEIYEKANNQLRLSRLSVTPRFTGTRPAMAEHMAILEAIEAGDEEAAAAAMSDHLEKSHQRAIGIM